MKLGEEIVLGRTVHKVTRASTKGVDLTGPRGGVSVLTPYASQPNLWAHLTMRGHRGSKTVNYSRAADGSFKEF